MARRRLLKIGAVGVFSNVVVIQRSAAPWFIYAVISVNKLKLL
jgi:hypothetical protein